MLLPGGTGDSDEPVLRQRALAGAALLMSGGVRSSNLRDREFETGLRTDLDSSESMPSRGRPGPYLTGAVPRPLLLTGLGNLNKLHEARGTRCNLAKPSRLAWRGVIQ